MIACLHSVVRESRSFRVILASGLHWHPPTTFNTCKIGYILLERSSNNRRENEWLPSTLRRARRQNLSASPIWMLANSQTCQLYPSTCGQIHQPVRFTGQRATKRANLSALPGSSGTNGKGKFR